MGLDSVIFTDGVAFFEELASRYITHSKGLFIMTPSGAGKTYFCKKQTEQHWIDGDDLWIESKAQPPFSIEWWNMGVDVINRVEQRCDIITAQAIDKGFWVLGSVNFWLKPDAIVIPQWDILVDRIRRRQVTDYDGGLTDNDQEQLKTHIRIIKEWHTKHGVPMYQSVEEAVSALTG